jgi:2-dehydro-3-deoxyphosphogluconate aldolase/(4S)-4-hydroxy-2-oxoglutarate aldolase
MIEMQFSGTLMERVYGIGLIPAVRTGDRSAAVRTAAAIGAGGIPIVEISMALPNGLEVLAAVVRELGAEMLVGAGTVLNGNVVRQAHGAGCQFVVTTGFDAGAVEAANQSGLPIFPGAMTPTEVQYALAAGCHTVKLFPCYATKGAAYVRTLHAQYPGINFIASGGVTLENCPEYFHAGACAVGVGSAIADSESISLGEFRIFKERAKRFRKVIAEAQARWRPEQSLLQA